jgi:hypothetical protein
METAITPKIFSGDELRARRHQVFDRFTARALSIVDSDFAEACKLVETALKAITEADESAVVETGQSAAQDQFTEQLDKAYGEPE